MTLWICTECTTPYAVGLHECPRCGSEDCMEEETMAKITRLGGPSNYRVEPAPIIVPGESTEPAPEPAPAEVAPEAEVPAAEAPKVELVIEPEEEPAPTRKAPAKKAANRR